MFAVEAAPIRDALAELAVRDPPLRARVRQQADDPAHADRCALLVDGRCAVYDARPLICRSHGLPIAAEPLATSGKPEAPLAIALFDARSQRVLQINQMASLFFGRPLEQTMGQVPAACCEPALAAALTGWLEASAASPDAVASTTLTSLGGAT